MLKRRRRVLRKSTLILLLVLAAAFTTIHLLYPDSQNQPYILSRIELDSSYAPLPPETKTNLENAILEIEGVEKVFVNPKYGTVVYQSADKETSDRIFGEFLTKTSFKAIKHKPKPLSEASGCPITGNRSMLRRMVSFLTF